MATIEISSPIHAVQLQLSTTDVSPLVPPFNTPEPLQSLAAEIAERAYIISGSFRDEEYAGYLKHQSLLSGDDFQVMAYRERELWPDAIGSFQDLLGKPLTREMIFQILALGMAATAIATIEIAGLGSYLGDQAAVDAEEHLAFSAL